MSRILKLVRDEGGWEPVLAADTEDLAQECLSRPEGYLVDDDAGRPLGVVEELEQGEHGAILVVADNGWLPGDRQRISTAAVVEIHPEEQRLVVATAEAAFDNHRHGRET